VRTYVSSVPKDDPEKLARELERVKKSLEKEQFFNKLLDQELKDLKNHSLGTTTLEPDYPTFVQKKRLSGGAIFFIFLIIAGGAGYFVYNKFFKQSGNLFPPEFSTTPASGSALTDTTTEAQSQFNSGDGSNKDPYGKVIDTSEIVAGKQPAPRNDDPVDDPPVDNSRKQAKQPEVKAEVKKKQPDPEPVEEDPIEEPVATKTVKTTPPPVTGSVAQGKNSTTPGTDIAANKPAPQLTNPAGVTAAPKSNTPATTPPVESRRVLAFYKVASKAFFYKAPDENTITNAFIFQMNPVRLGALDDQNGFIFVVYTNDIGYTIRGWLSKKDLTKVE
jgi:hypothetical protein